MQMFTRGDQLEFTAVFTADGFPGAQPGAAQIAITFPSGITRERRVYAMALWNDCKWRFVWDSGEAPTGGRVNYSIRATGAVKDVEDGSFMLAANDANI